MEYRDCTESTLRRQSARQLSIDVLMSCGGDEASFVRLDIVLSRRSLELAALHRCWLQALEVVRPRCRVYGARVCNLLRA